MKNILRHIYLVSCVLYLVSLTSCPEKSTGPDGVAVPTNITIELVSGNTIRLTWNCNSDDISAFHIERRVGENPWQFNYAVVDPDSYSFSEPFNPNSDTLIAYRVRTIIDSDSSLESAACVLFPSKTTPNNLSIKQIDLHNFRLQWQDNSIGEDYFAIDKKTGSGDWKLNYLLIPANRTECFDKAGSESDTIYYRISAKIGDSRSAVSSAVFRKLTPLSLENLYFGTEKSFEVATWNLEHFPRNNDITISSVARAIRALDIDIIALQEIEGSTGFYSLVDSLDHYQGIRATSAYSGINLAFLYNTNSITIDSGYEILENERRALPRSPLVLKGAWYGIPFIVINNHYKCCGDGVIEHGNAGDEEYRRFRASELLENYIQSHFDDQNVIVVGDFNDEITDHQNNNVFQPFINQPDAYLFTDMDIATGSSTLWSYPTWPSHIDHILISNELFDEFNDTGSDIQTIVIDNYLSGGWNEYAVKISDHRPVALKIYFSE
jgi:endonuclease/exonuclease/phosphatase family metal-dependent hydrolase